MIPRAFKNARIDGFYGKTEADHYSAMVKRFLSEKKGLFLYGNVGNGKTSLMAVACKYVLKNVCPEAVLWVDGVNFGYIPRDKFESNESAGERFLLDLVNKKYIFLDEFSIENMLKGVNQDLFYKLFYRIMNNEGEPKLFITSNNSVTDIMQKLSERVSSRIHQICTVVGIDGNDFRTKED